MHEVCYYRIFGELLVMNDNAIDFKKLEVVIEKMQENREIFTPRIEGWPILTTFVTKRTNNLYEII